MNFVLGIGLGILLGIIASIFTLEFSGNTPSDSRTLGMIRIASGQWSCELIEGPDKTTEWECLENEK